MKRNILLPALLLLSIFPSSNLFASVGLFSFKTDSQIILQNTLSGPITIQSQNSSGAVESVSETFDLNFNSSSPTGLFLGSTGKTVSKTMAKNSANRTFYYKDNSVGSFTLTVNATGRDSKKSFKIVQNIVVSKESVVKKVVLPVTKIVSKPVNNITKENSVQNSEASSSEVVVFEAPQHQSLISKIFNFIKHLFVEE